MRRRLPLVLLLVALVLTPFPASDAEVPSALCGRLDLPETGIQGTVPRADRASGRALQGYNRGVALVGFSPLSGRDGSANMAWTDDCAFIASTNGVSVVDVSDPRDPRHVATLQSEAATFSLETIAAVKAGDREVLAVGRYGPAPIPLSTPIDLYDVSDCSNPRLASRFTTGENAHNLTFSPDGKRLYITQPIQVVDVADITKPVYLGNLEAQTRGTMLDFYAAHEVELSPDGNTMYVGGQTTAFRVFKVIDITGWPQRKPRILMQELQPGHGVNYATIGGRKYAIHSEESIAGPLALGCVPQTLNPITGAAQPFISDVDDRGNPRMRISQVTLAINDRDNCATQLTDAVNASVHYHDVDDPENTTFLMASMWNAGLRIFDLRDPYRPREVAYFNPGAFLEGGDPVLDQAWGHVRYDPVTGHMWFATSSGGFWVLELEPQVRAALGLPAKPTNNPEGAPPRPPATRAAVAPTAVDLANYYCTLATGVGAF